MKTFHLAALLHASLDRQTEAAGKLLAGLVTRLDQDFDLPDGDLPTDRARWEADLAVYLVQASGAGVPLSAREARLVHREYRAALAELDAWSGWDPWDRTRADGIYPLRPESHIRVEDMAWFLWHCWSPFRDPVGAEVVDCKIVRDPLRWGE